MPAKNGHNGNGHNGHGRARAEKQPKHQNDKPAMRSFWSGTISFGLINIPVRLYSATQERNLDLDMLRKGDLCPIKFARVCRATGEEVPYNDIVKGYQYEKGDYVVLDEDDFKRANVKKTQTIEVVSFANESEIDPKYFEKPYYLEPGKGAAKSYALLREALKRSKKVGVARFVLRTREYLAILRAEDDVIILDQMRFASEIRDPASLALPKRAEVNAKEIEVALKLVDTLTAPFEIEEFHDTYREELEEVIEEKAHGKQPRARGRALKPTAVPDLMAALRASLEREHKRRDHSGAVMHA